METFPLNLLTLPVWWYSIGLKSVWQWYKKKTHYTLQETGLVLFARHLYEPLYQDYTRSGRILGFFLRIFLLIFKTIIFLVNAVFYGLLVVLYLLILPTTIMMIVFQIFQTK